MAEISRLSRLVNGIVRNVDLSANTLVVQDIKVGATLLTQATLDSVIALRSDLAATGGAALVGILDTAAQYAATTVEGALTEVMDATQAAQADADAAQADATQALSDAADAQADATQALADAAAAQADATQALADAAAAQATADAAIPLTQKGANNGVATLDAGGKVPVAQLPSSVMTYEGVWNASTNSPALVDGTGDAGMVYRVGTAGSQDLGSGSISFAVGDYVIYNGTIWEKSDTTDAVASVNGQTGIVSLDTDDIAEGTAQYFTDERAQDAVGTILADSATIDFTYTDGTPEITAAVKTNSIDETHLTASVAGDGLNGGNGTALSVDVGDLAGTGLENDGSNNLRIAASAAGAGLAGGAGSALSVAYSPKGQRSVVAGESMAANTSWAVRWALTGETAGRAYKADNDASSTNKFYAFGIALKTSAIAAADPVDVVFEGEYTLGSSDAAFNAADVGKPVYLGAAGALTLTAPTADNTAVWRIGTVMTTTKIWVGDKQLNGIN